MFIVTNTTKPEIINLKNVSNINILNSNRIVFNMNYSVKILNNNKIISDYSYWDSGSTEEHDDNIESILQNTYVQNNFLVYNSAMINVHEISTVKFDDFKNRIIFNLSHPVSFNGTKPDDTTSEFVYVNLEKSLYEEEKKYLLKEMQEW